MFEKKEPFHWRIPVLIITGVIVLTGGIYLGVKSINNDNKPKNVATEQQSKEQSKNAFNLSKDCEIWLNKKNLDGSDSNQSPVMIGTVDEELLNKSREEIISYLNEKYPDREVQSLSKYEIVLSEKSENIVNDTDKSKANKYSLELDNEYIGLYKYDENGIKSLVEKTEIRIDSLPASIQDEVKKGIIIDTEEDAYSQLESLGS